MTTSTSCKILHLPDLHVGHNRVPSQELYDHLKVELYPQLVGIDLLNIGGDFFDGLINMNSDAGVTASVIIDDMINMALTHNFYIRIPRGTFTHDRYQNRHWLVKDRGGHMLNGAPLVRVIDNLEIELFPSLGISVLYCPDDLPYADLSQAIVDVIENQGMSSVDFIFSHGYYEHLLPSGIPKIPHNTIQYSRVERYVRGALLNGHVHTPSVYKKVINGGSFERFQHGEEENKGYFIITYDPVKGKVSHKFYKNNMAYTYTSLFVESYLTPEDLFKAVEVLIDKDAELSGLTDRKINVRLVGNTEYITDYIKNTYPNVNISNKRSVLNTMPLDTIRTYYDDLPVITEDNLPGLIKLGMKDTDISLSEAEIKEILHATAN